jgi:hypothetical protein
MDNATDTGTAKKDKIWAGRQKDYFKEYYLNKVVKPSVCAHCSTAFNSDKAHKNHLNKSLRCKMIRMEQEIQNLKEKQ